MAAIRPMGRARVAGRILGGLALVLLVPILVVFAAANGVTTSTLALTALALAIGLICFVRLPAAGRGRAALLAVTTLCVLGILTFVGARLFAAPPPQSFRFVEEGRRDAPPPWISRLADERETVLVGLHLSNALGFVKGREKDHLEELLLSAYSAPWRPWPNAALIDSSPDSARHLEHVPTGIARLPCIVFLHGFGGQLTAYLRVLHQAFGSRFAIVAPFLDYTGAFWTPRGKAVVRTLVTRDLPPEVDRTRMFLVGLSNGAAGATAILQDPELSGRFRGFVLVSGVSEIGQPSLRANVLLIAGTKDDRFPLEYIKGAAEALRESGAQVQLEAFPADHFLWLSHAQEMTTTIDSWVSAQLEK
jgi:predicted esterase